MQIVCRDLYNEATNNGKKKGQSITDDQYRAGGEVTGRLNAHISRSLLTAVTLAGAGRRAEAEEGIWRKVLLKLVSRQSDGSVETAILTERQLSEVAQSLRTR